ncbi:hypothetical protein CRENBAI_026747 [Crenichthys baileyi]|uniref:Tripartite motif-containing protein 16-like n=1 Tax=Crenichthys baileyi TaxID=28760 RepID=A0AAV9RPD1_9TELE
MTSSSDKPAGMSLGTYLRTNSYHLSHNRPRGKPSPLNGITPPYLSDLGNLKDPVTIPCGHSYCRNCIKNHWNGEDQRRIYSCPQCRKTFTPRPVLEKNRKIEALMEKIKNAAPADHCYAGPEDVACDVCTERKMKAVKLCLVCLASYCDNHLQPHYSAPPLKKHKLVNPSKKLQNNICSRHDEVMKIFCRTDQQCICYLCSMDQHKGHETVPAAAERTEKQKELQVSRQQIQQRIQDQEKDLKLLQKEDPVTIPCGHSYCMNCIKEHWDGEDQRRIHSCPRCRKTFRQRPALLKNIMLPELVEDLKKTGLQAPPADHRYAKPKDVACDVCTGEEGKLSDPKHKLVDPSKNLQENICSRHDEVMKIFCRTDQQCICYLCSMDEHKGHETIPAAAERTEKQKELQVSREQILQRIQDQEKDLKLLQQEVEAINVSADKAIETKRSSDVKQQIRSQQETEVSRVKELQEKLEQEITELKRKDAELVQLSNTEDHNQFLHNYPSLSALRESTHSSSINIRPLRYFEDVTAAVSELIDKLQDILRDTWTNISLMVTEVDVLLLRPEPKTRADFLKYFRHITLDPHTAYKHLCLSDENRRATLMKQQQSYPDHPDRFSAWIQVLSRESLTGRCYWEVEWEGRGVEVAVSYHNISRAGNSDKCAFGVNDKSWALHCDSKSYKYRHNKVQTTLSGPVSSRVGVFLDHRAGILSFYSVSETMTLLRRVQTTFTQPLHAGIQFFYYYLYYSGGDTAEFIKLSQD